ncbi:hypothetical protein HPB47_008215 [Ixodes persulcatus]|uniref:Uncharacterized protein n=1 Tax=Ixodes persulcatus TaxID=34615 RepID=A0AC60P5E9_IXOPE|nr:hypothetical protein HPB47_008215 [Ixodes persulcatus]
MLVCLWASTVGAVVWSDTPQCHNLSLVGSTPHPYFQPVYSASTGFYTENHGIVGNFMYNQELNVYFKMAASESMEPHWWNQAEPIWVSAVRRNLIVDMHWWDGCQVDFNGTKPNFCTEYKGTWSTVNSETKDLVEKSLNAMKESSLDMAMFYYEGPDSAGEVNVRYNFRLLVDHIRICEDALDHGQPAFG